MVFYIQMGIRPHEVDGKANLHVFYHHVMYHSFVIGTSLVDEITLSDISTDYSLFHYPEC